VECREYRRPGFLGQRAVLRQKGTQGSAPTSAAVRTFFSFMPRVEAARAQPDKGDAVAMLGRYWLHLEDETGDASLSARSGAVPPVAAAARAPRSATPCNNSRTPKLLSALFF